MAAGPRRQQQKKLFSSSLSSHPVAKSLSAPLDYRVMLSYARSLLAEAKSLDTHRRTHTVTCGRLSHALSGVLLDKDAAVVIPWAALPPTRCCGRRGDSRPRDKEAPQSAAGWRRVEWGRWGHKLRLSDCYVIPLLCSVCLLEVTGFGLILSKMYFFPP